MESASQASPLAMRIAFLPPPPPQLPNSAFDDTDSGYTEIPMMTTTPPSPTPPPPQGLRDRVARFVFRQRQTQQQPQHGSSPIPRAPSSAQPQRRALRQQHRYPEGDYPGDRHPGVAYTRWEFLQPRQQAQPQPQQQQPPRTQQTAGSKSVRFRCPSSYAEHDDNNDDKNSATVQPYSVSAVCGGHAGASSSWSCLGGLGDRSASSGYGSDMDIVGGGGGGGGDSPWAVREEDIDRLLVGRSACRRHPSFAFPYSSSTSKSIPSSSSSSVQEPAIGADGHYELLLLSLAIFVTVTNVSVCFA